MQNIEAAKPNSPGRRFCSDSLRISPQSLDYCAGRLSLFGCRVARQGNSRIPNPGENFLRLFPSVGGWLTEGNPILNKIGRPFPASEKIYLRVGREPSIVHGVNQLMHNLFGSGVVSNVKRFPVPDGYWKCLVRRNTPRNSTFDKCFSMCSYSFRKKLHRLVDNIELSTSGPHGNAPTPWGPRSVGRSSVSRRCLRPGEPRIYTFSTESRLC